MDDPRVAELTARVALLEEELEETNRGILALELEVARKDAEMRTMSEQLWQSAKLAAVGELAASIVHELNNPLATLSMRLEMLLEDLPEGDPGRRPFEVMERETRRMSGLVSNLLHFARRRRLQTLPVALEAEVAHTVDLILWHISKRGVTVDLDFPQDLPLVQADPQQLHQVFLNLLTNAADAMPQGGTVTFRGHLMPDGRVATDVVDQGCGIPPENLSRVLQAFFTTKPEGKGTGLGLAICRRILEEHRGEISIQSVVGQGTTVRVVLPVAS